MIIQALHQLLVTDASCVAHLTYILDHLSASCLAPSPHLQRWVTRVTALMHSKDPAARWAAIFIAYRMSFLSWSLLLENAQSWVGIIFPFLSKPEPFPILRASMRYLTLVLSSAKHNLEFQRQVALPIVPKVSSALLTIAERYNDQDIKTSSIRALAQLVPLYPSLHKSLSQRLFALCHQVFNGSVHHTTDSLLDATVNLFAVVHFLGGRVGGTSLLRDCLDEALQISWSAWLALRTTFPTSVQLSHKAITCFCSPDGKLPNPLSDVDATGDPLSTTALNLDRLNCGINAIAALLRAPANRPVRVPVGHLAAFCWCLLASTREEEEQPHVDPHIRIAESAAVPQIWIHACRLLSSLVQTTQELLAPYASRFITAISTHLEHNLEPPERHSFLRCAYHLLYFCPVVGPTLAINRLLKATIFILSPLYLPQPHEELSSVATSQSRSGKRRREYETDNILSAANVMICATTPECEALITALDVVDQCMLNAELAPSARSFATRVLLSILMSRPSMPHSSLSSDPSFHAKVTNKVRDICVGSIQGTSHAMSKSAGLVLRSFSENLATRDKTHSLIELLLHPRCPPYVRTLPFVKSLSLPSAGESAEDTVTRQSLELDFDHGEIRPITLGPETHENQTQSELMIQRAAQEARAPSLAPVSTSSEVVAGVQVGAPPPIPPKDSTTIVYAAPMLVDEFDEEVPTIDLGSDSDA